MGKRYVKGNFVSLKTDEKQLYFVVGYKMKYGNKLITCLPVIHKKARTPIDRCVYATFKDMLVVINRPEQYFEYMLDYRKPSMSADITDRIIEKYKAFNPKLFDFEDQDYTDSDGYNVGNPWKGMQLMKRRPKFYRG